MWTPWLTVCVCVDWFKNILSAKWNGGNSNSQLSTAMQASKQSKLKRCKNTVCNISALSQCPFHWINTAVLEKCRTLLMIHSNVSWISFVSGDQTTCGKWMHDVCDPLHLANTHMNCWVLLLCSLLQGCGQRPFTDDDLRCGQVGRRQKMNEIWVQPQPLPVPQWHSRLRICNNRECIHSSTMLWHQRMFWDGKFISLTLLWLVILSLVCGTNQPLHFLGPTRHTISRNRDK